MATGQDAKKTVSAETIIDKLRKAKRHQQGQAPG